MQAVRLVKHGGWSTRKTALHLGYDHSTVIRWLQKHPTYGKHRRVVSYPPCPADRITTQDRSRQRWYLVSWRSGQRESSARRSSTTGFKGKASWLVSLPSSEYSRNMDAPGSVPGRSSTGTHPALPGYPMPAPETRSGKPGDRTSTTAWDSSMNSALLSLFGRRMARWWYWVTRTNRYMPFVVNGAQRKMRSAVSLLTLGQSQQSVFWCWFPDGSSGIG